MQSSVAKNTLLLSAATRSSLSKVVQRGSVAEAKKAASYGVQGTSYMLPWKGDPADKKPMRMKLEAGKTYVWCACGHSKRQPFCDGSHNRDGLTQLRPVTYIPERDEEKLWCLCKKTANRPFCDGAHKKLPPGPIDKLRHTLWAYDKNPPHVTQGVAKRLGLKDKNGGFK